MYSRARVAQGPPGSPESPRIARIAKAAKMTKSDEMAVLLILLVLAVLGLLCQLQAESNSEAGVQARAIPPHSPGPREACLGRVGLSWTTGGISGQGSLLLDHGRHIWAG